MLRKNAWTIVAMSCLSLAGGWFYLSLQGSQVSQRAAQLHEIVDQVEMDYGIYDSLTSRDEPALIRAKRASEVGLRRAEEQKRYMDSLTAALRADDEAGIGYGYVEQQVKQPPKARVTEDGVLVMVDDDR